jgi:adenylate cyclase
MSANDILVLDPSASRHHAKIHFNEEDNHIILQDLGSTNGTFLNRERISSPRELTINDIIRIGQHQIELSFLETQDIGKTTIPQKSHFMTRDLLLQSLDRHAVLLAEVASRLNNVLDLQTALKEVASLAREVMGADRCEVLLPEQFDHLSELGFASSIAKQAIETRSAVVLQDAQSNPKVGKSAALLRIHAAMCVPILSGDQLLGLIYIYKNRSEARPFEQRDVQLAVAIGHQTALTIQRMQLLARVRREEFVSSLLQRFLSRQEAEFVLKEYFESGQLPPLSEHNLTVLVADIVGSTQMAERLGSRRFGDILARYYQEITEIIFAHHGMLNKYIGDGLMAVFGLPHQPSNPEESAILTAIEILKQLQTITKETGELINVGIGINTGIALAGYMGALEHVEFSVVGYPVNVAWGLEALARPNRIFVGRPTYQAVAERFNLRPLGRVEIKKDSEPIDAYEVIP